MSVIFKCTSLPLRQSKFNTIHNYHAFKTPSTKMYKRSFAGVSDEIIFDFPSLQEPPEEPRVPFQGMELLVLGTASAKPHAESSLSSCVLRLSRRSILFDSGDGVQSLLLKNKIRCTTIKQILITHLHGDHIFGLPALVTLLAMTNLPTPHPNIEIYGPAGLRKFLRTTFSVSKTLYSPGSFLVHEISFQNQTSDEPPAEGEKNFLYDSTLKGWKIMETETETIYAAPIRHTVFCLGYVVEEKQKKPSLNASKLQAAGYPPGPLYKAIKKGEIKFLKTKDGAEEPIENFVFQKAAGRKLVYLGDTSDASQIQHLANDCDLLVHEATLELKNEHLANERGHSTAVMAAKFASKINARNLCLTHFGHALIDPDQFQLTKQEASEHFRNPIHLAEPSLILHVMQSKEVMTSKNKQRD